jgi:splicing factor, arginine/serine-rich 17
MPASDAAAAQPTEPLPLPSGLSLAPRLKLLLTFFRADLTVRPLDEWQLKSALLAFLRDPPLSLPVVPDSDLSVRRLPDLQKRRREEPVATGVLHVRDLAFLRPRKSNGEAEEMTQEQEEEKYFEWRSSLVEKLAGVELNLQGVKFRMTVEIPPSDDFWAMKKSWEDFYSSELLNSSTNWSISLYSWLQSLLGGVDLWLLLLFRESCEKDSEKAGHNYCPWCAVQVVCRDKGIVQAIHTGHTHYLLRDW